MTHRNCIIKTAFVLLAALVGSLFNEHCGAASTNAMDKTPTDTNLAAIKGSVLVLTVTRDGIKPMACPGS